jgi:hypothetical protein
VVARYKLDLNGTVIFSGSGGGEEEEMKERSAIGIDPDS